MFIGGQNTRQNAELCYTYWQRTEGRGRGQIADDGGQKTQDSGRLWSVASVFRGERGG